MSRNSGPSPVIGVIIMVGLTLVLSFVIGHFVLGVGGAEAQEPADPLEEHDIQRVVDDEAGVVCYIYTRKGYAGGGVDCIPINDTRLTQGGSS